MTRTERIRGGLLGLLVGDALGVPYEFHAPHELPEVITFVPPRGFARAHASQPPGVWSDDGSQALCLLDSLLACDGLDPADFADRMLRWWQQGYLTSTGEVFDIGIQTTEAFRRLSGGVPPASAGLAGEFHNGNGSLMRTLPMALWHRGPDSELVELAHAQSRVTHAHPRSMISCALYCLWARRVLEGDAEPWASAEGSLNSYYAAHDADFHAELTEKVLPGVPPAGSGYVLDTLHTARYCIDRGGSYAEMVRRAVAFGHDTDTTAAVVGGIAGLLHGEGAIPAAWREGLVGMAMVEGLLTRLRAAPRSS